MKDTLFDKVQRVNDEKSFIQFLDELRKDNKSNPDEWENQSISLYLEGAFEWANASIEGLSLYNKPENPWRRCADILYMGKIYE